MELSHNHAKTTVDVADRVDNFFQTTDDCISHAPRAHRSTASFADKLGTPAMKF
jgi:hypothetical protein